jgi:hypothetical protein
VFFSKTRPPQDNLSSRIIARIYLHVGTIFIFQHAGLRLFLWGTNADRQTRVRVFWEVTLGYFTDIWKERIALIFKDPGSKKNDEFGQHNSILLVTHFQSNPQRALISLGPGSKKHDEFGQHNSVVLVNDSQPNPHKALIFKDLGSKNNDEFGQHNSVLPVNHSQPNPHKHNTRTL